MIWKKLTILTTASIKDALKQLDRTAMKTLFIVDESDHLLGTITDGDIRRSLLNCGTLNDPIKKIYKTNSFSVKIGDYNEEVVRKKMLEGPIFCVPVLDTSKKIVDCIFWDKEVAVPNKNQNCLLNIPIVIMAGGKGTRLLPFTHVLPKPLIPIGEKTILEIILDEFEAFGASKYYFTINYRGEMIQAYFKGIEKQYDIEYLWEKNFNGTAGSLILLPEDIPDTLIVSNCDIIVKADYSDVIKFHREKEADLTILSSIQHHQIPYGVVKYGEQCVVKRITEKPEYSMPINTGVYIIDKKCLSLIKRDCVFHMTHLIDSLIENSKNVYTYIVNENDYIDIGQWEEYHKAVDQFKYKN